MSRQFSLYIGLLCGAGAGVAGDKLACGSEELDVSLQLTNFETCREADHEALSGSSDSFGPSIGSALMSEQEGYGKELAADRARATQLKDAERVAQPQRGA